MKTPIIKTKWLLFFLVLVVMIFFQVNFVSDVYLAIGDSLEPGKKAKFYKLSHRVFPFDHAAAYKYGHELLKAGYEKNNETALQAAVQWFKKAVSRNPLHYYSHYYLGKSYLFYNNPGNNVFNRAVSEFKKAAVIRGSSIIVARDTCKILLSLWPLLNDSDKQFCRNLLARSIEHFQPVDFNGIVEPWWLYSKDKTFLLHILEKKPVFYYTTAEKLMELEAPLPFRWELLAKYEKFILDEVHHQYQSQALHRQYRPGPLLPLLEKLNAVHAYYNLARDETFDEKKYNTLKNNILYQVIVSFFERTPGKNTQKAGHEKTVEQYISQYITGKLPGDQLLTFKEYLTKKGFFKENDFTSFYFNYLLEFQMGNYSGIISGIEELKNSIAYINTGRRRQRARYIQLLLLLADAYESSKLLSAARGCLNEIIQIDPGNLDACIRLLRIQQVLGKDEGTREQVKENLEAINNSRIFAPDSIPCRIKKTVYFTGSPSIEITIRDPFKEEVKTPQTYFLQVFIDTKIKHESFIFLSPDAVFPAKIEPPLEITPMARHMVEVVVKK